MSLLGRGVDPGHCFGQLGIDIIFDRHGAEIRVFTSKRFGRLIGMFEPVISNHGRLPQGCGDIALETSGALIWLATPVRRRLYWAGRNRHRERKPGNQARLTG